MKKESATLGGGCFWCLEAVYQEMKGVEGVVSGYTGGFSENPSYQAICTGTTGHAEVCQITYNSEVTSFRRLLEVFFVIHDPTTLNYQGNDRGTQYRSAIFYESEGQKKIAEEIIKELDDRKAFGDPIVTEVVPLEKFFPAEDYHQNYYRKNPNEGYCTAIVAPKLQKFRDTFAQLQA